MPNTAILIETDIPELILRVDTSGSQILFLIIEENLDGCRWLAAPFPGILAARTTPLCSIFKGNGIQECSADPSDILTGSFKLAPMGEVFDRVLPTKGWVLPNWVEFPSWANP